MFTTLMIIAMAAVNAGFVYGVLDPVAIRAYIAGSWKQLKEKVL